MKKKEAKNNKKLDPPERRTKTNYGDSDLGNWGLEPPKIYKNNHKSNDLSKLEKTKQRKRSVNSKKTIQQQRIDENKRRRRKKLTRKIILYCALAVGVAAVIIFLSLTVFFKIQTISISGNEIYSKKEISAVLPIEKEKNLFLADTKSAEAKLEENLPYIYDADIQRKFPSTIRVNIVETPRVYAINNEDKTYTLLDDNFKVLELGAKKKPKKSITIKKTKLKTAVAGQKAEFADKRVEENLSKLIEAVRTMKLEKITAIYSIDINNNYLVYDGRITIKLGEADKLENKIYSALAAIEKIEEQNPLAEGELTVGTGKQIYFTET